MNDLSSLQSEEWLLFRNISELHFEITPSCNLKCSYCYVGPKEKKEGIELFPLQLFYRIIGLIAEYSKQEHIEIIYHGGEPLLQSYEWFDSACRFATETFKKANRKCSFGLQSNLTLLNDDFIDVFIRNKIRVSTSIDGSETIHNSVRGGFKITTSNMRKIMENGIFSGCIVVAYKHNWDQISSVFKTLSELGVGLFHINIASMSGDSKINLPLSTEQIFKVYTDTYYSMLEYDGQIVETRLYDKLVRYINNPTGEELLQELRCDNPFCHAGINMLYFRYNGDMLPCGSTAGTDDKMELFKLGNIINSLDKSVFKEKFHAFHRKSEKYEKECIRCGAMFICEFNCPAFDIHDQVTADNRCSATRKLKIFLDNQPIEDIQRIIAFKLDPNKYQKE